MPRPAGLVVKNGSPTRASTSAGHSRPAIARSRSGCAPPARRDAQRRRRRPAATPAARSRSAPSSAWPTARGGTRQRRGRRPPRRSRRRTGDARRGDAARPRCRPAPSTGHRREALARRVARVGAHALDDGAAALDLARAPAARPRRRARRRPRCATSRCRSPAITAIVDSGVSSSCAAPAASVASDASRSWRCAAAARRVQLALATLQRAPDAQQEVDDERRARRRTRPTCRAGAGSCGGV